MFHKSRSFQLFSGWIDENQNQNLILLILILFGISMRLMAVVRNPVNANEASILMHLGQTEMPSYVSTSILESLFIKISFYLFGASELAARIWPFLAGCLLLALPSFFIKQKNPRFALILTGLIAIDPFFITNSIQIGTNIFSVLSGCVLAVTLKRRNYRMALLSLIVLFLSGTGFILSFLLIIGVSIQDKERSKELLKGFILYIQHVKYYLLLILAALCLSLILLDIDFSAFIGGTNHLFYSTVAKQGISFSRRGAILIIFSYAPFPFILFLISLLLVGKENRKYFYLTLALSIICLMYFLLFPNQSYAALIWVVLPIIIGSAWIIGGDKTNILNRYSVAMALVLIILFTCSFLTFGSFISNGYEGRSQYNAVTSLAAILFLIIAGCLYSLYLQKGREFGISTIIALILIMLIFQVSIAFRGSGLTGNPDRELLWTGASNDQKTLAHILDSFAVTKEISSESVRYALEDSLSPQLSWQLRDHDIRYISAGMTGPSNFNVVITEKEALLLDGLYVGQHIVVNSYPNWVKTPIISLLDYDYWSWLLFRKSSESFEVNYLWKSLN